MLKRYVNSLVLYFESGDLIPLVILISVPHYAFVLSKYDFWFVASVLGFLLDLGHYRTIKAYQKGNGALWMLILTVFSFGFHGAFYWLGGAQWASLFFGAAVPVVIFALAYLSFNEKWAKQAEKGSIETPVVLPQVQLTLDTQTKPLELERPKPPTWHTLTDEQKKVVVDLTTAEIAAQYGVSERTARNWRNH